MGLESIKKNDALIVQPALGHGGPLRGRVERFTDHYVWVDVAGLRDTVRVARVSGRGTHHGTSYIVSQADEATLERVDRAVVHERLRAAVYLADRSCREHGIDATFSGVSIAELEELDRRIRGAVRTDLTPKSSAIRKAG